MILFVIALICIAIGLILIPVFKHTADSLEPIPVGLAAIPLALGAFFVFWTCTTVVEARSVGIQTAFGSYVGTLDNGFHVIAPWTSVEKFTTTIQTVPIEGDGNVSVTYSTLSESTDVKSDLAGGGKGYFDGNYAWSISPDGQGTRALWERYREFDRVSRELVAPSIRDAIVAVGSTYSASQAPIMQPEISEKVKVELQKRLATYGVAIDRVSITSISNDPNTQASLDKIVNAQNDIRRAREEQTRAKIDAETAKLRESTGALSPAANQRYCLDIVNSWDQGKNGQLPATFNCSLTGSGVAGVIVGQK